MNSFVLTDKLAELAEVQGASQALATAEAAYDAARAVPGAWQPRSAAARRRRAAARDLDVAMAAAARLLTEDWHHRRPDAGQAAEGRENAMTTYHTHCACIASTEPDRLRWHCPACPNCSEDDHRESYLRAWAAWNLEWSREAAEHVAHCERAK